MKSSLIIAAASLGMLASTANAQLTTLVAGWDFNAGTTTTPVQSSGINYAPRYSENPTTAALVDGSSSSGLSVTTAGRLWINGTNGSHVWTINANTGVSFFQNPGTPDEQINTRALNSPNDFLGELSGNEFSLQFLTNADGGNDKRFSFQLALQGRKITDIEFQARLAGSAQASATNLVINWLYLDSLSGTVQNTGLSTAISTGTAWNNYAVNFSSLNLTDATNDFALIGEITGGITDANIQLDNFAVYGVIPEPSTYALFIAAGTLGFVAFRRYSRKK